METKKSKKSLTFTLKGFNVRDLEDRYGISMESNIGDSIAAPRCSTSIEGLSMNNCEKRMFSYFDESKKSHRCVCTMLDCGSEPLPTKTSMCCFWCRHQFSTIPIGCPLEYVSSEVVKTYYSEITKDIYTIREKISKQKRESLEQQTTSNPDIKLAINKKEYYITDGIFCSFNCALSFIMENEYKPQYNLSKSLLVSMYEQIFNEQCNIIPAPSWRLLTSYGGEQSIEEFRDNFNKIEFIDLNNSITNLPQFYACGQLFEQKIKF